MPSFFSFEQGNESRPQYHQTDASPLLGRYRAVPRARRGSLGLLTRASWRGSVHIGYGALLTAGLAEQDASGDDYNDDSDDDNENDESALVRWARRAWKRTHDLWITPTQSAVKKVTDVWWSRWFVLVVLPAALVCVQQLRLSDGIEAMEHVTLNGLLTSSRRLSAGVPYRFLNTRYQTTPIKDLRDPDPDQAIKYLVTDNLRSRSTFGSFVLSIMPCIM